MSGTQVVNLDHERSMPMPPSATTPEGSSCNLNGRDTQQVSPGVVGQQHRLTRSLISVGSNVCRICHTNTAKEPLISPCRCKGTLAYVHLSCLERWLNQSCRTYCELCRYCFNAVETPRYRWPESLRIWISHPRNRTNIQSDLLILTLLTIVTAGLAAVCLLGMRYFIIEGKKIGISKLWTRGAIWFFLTAVILGYVTTVYLLGRAAYRRRGSVNPPGHRLYVAVSTTPSCCGLCLYCAISPGQIATPAPGGRIKVQRTKYRHGTGGGRAPSMSGLSWILNCFVVDLRTSPFRSTRVKTG